MIVSEMHIKNKFARQNFVLACPAQVIASSENSLVELWQTLHCLNLVVKKVFSTERPNLVYREPQ